MNIIGINAYLPGSSVAHVKDRNICFAGCESKTELITTRFPTSALETVREHIDSVDYIVYTDSRVKEQLPLHLKRKSIKVSYLNALAMSAVVTRNWDTCAVLIVDTWHTSLGYYAAGEFFWLKHFEYPNNLCLFYSAVTRFLGKQPLLEEHAVEEAYQYADPTFVNWMQERVINYSDGDFKLLVNAERGIGSAAFVPEIAASAQLIFSSIIVSLANWLQKQFATKNLAYAGWGSRNITTNTVLQTLHNNLAIQPAYGAMGTSLGASALIQRPVWNHPFLGSYSNINELPDTLAQQLLQGAISTINSGRESFSYRNQLLGSKIAIPYATNAQQFKDYILICLEKDYSAHFDQNHSWGLTRVRLKTQEYANIIGYTHRVVPINSSSYPYLNRVLEITKAKGFPILAVQQ